MRTQPALTSEPIKKTRRALVLRAVSCVALALAYNRAWAEEALLPSARVGVGPALRLGPGDERAPRLAFDATAGAIYANRTGGVFKADVLLGLEAGYAYDGLRTHALAIAPMVGYGAPLAFLAYQPRLLVGGAGGATAIGMRNGLALHLLLALGSVEVSHQLVSCAGERTQSVQLTLSVNLGLLIAAACAMSADLLPL